MSWPYRFWEASITTIGGPLEPWMEGVARTGIKIDLW
jgi:hypothetical protein